MGFLFIPPWFCEIEIELVEFSFVFGFVYSPSGITGWALFFQVISGKWMGTQLSLSKKQPMFQAHRHSLKKLVWLLKVSQSSRLLIPFFSLAPSLYIYHTETHIHTYIYMCLFVCVYFGLGGGSWDF